MRNVIISLLLAFPVASFAQVNLNTGSPEFSIPVYSYSDKKSGLSLSTALVYDPGNGIKVSQLASNIGLGWNYICSGVVMRRQNGLPDDQHRTNGEQYLQYYTNTHCRR